MTIKIPYKRLRRGRIELSVHNVTGGSSDAVQAGRGFSAAGEGKDNAFGKNGAKELHARRKRDGLWTLNKDEYYT